MSAIQIVDDPPATERGGFYVSCIHHDGQRALQLAGPFDTHDEAKALVPAVKRLAESLDRRAFWYSFGTCRVMEGGERHPGKLNEHLAVLGLGSLTWTA